MTTSLKLLNKTYDKVKQKFAIQHPVNHRSLKIPSYYHIDPPKKPAIIDLMNFNKSSRKLIEEDSDPTLLNFERGIIEIPFNDQVLINDARYMHYSRNRKCIILKDELLYRQRSYNEVSDISVTTKTNFYHTFQVLARYSKQACGHLPDDAGNIKRILFPINLQITTKLDTTLRRLLSMQTN